MKNKIGIIGGGQLGRMMTVEAKKLGFFVTILDPVPDSPAGQVADAQIIADYNDENAIVNLARAVDYITFETESANGHFFDELEKKVSCIINPSGKSWRIFQDKLEQKKLFAAHNIPQPRFIVISQNADMKKAAEKWGFPFLLKARFDAYDGKGNMLIKNTGDIDAAWNTSNNKKLYAEEYVRFDKELAVMAARNSEGKIILYPVVETIQKNNICHYVCAPAQISSSVQKKVHTITIKTTKLLKGAGVFGIEMFMKKDGSILINEVAPRVHNSGHYTIEACVTSQFEQHIRAITGLPLGETTMKTPVAVMQNILGERMGEAEVTGLDDALKIPNVSIHIYGKKNTKPERKMGHITATAKTRREAFRKVSNARKYINI